MNKKSAFPDEAATAPASAMVWDWPHFIVQLNLSFLRSNSTMACCGTRK